MYPFFLLVGEKISKNLVAYSVYKNHKGNTIYITKLQVTVYSVSEHQTPCCSATYERDVGVNYPFCEAKINTFYAINYYL